MCELFVKKTYKEYERIIGDEEAEHAKSCRRQLLASSLASLMSFSSGMVIAGWASTDGEARPSDGSGDDLALLSVEQQSWIQSVYVFGALIGALPAGYLSQKYGRKYFLLWLAWPMTAGWLVCLLRLDNLGLECFGRFLCGLSLGATTVAVPLYASDVSSDVLRGRTGVFLDFTLCAGILFAYVARTVLSGLRHFCLVCALVPVLFVTLFSHMPESPIHLFNQGQHLEAVAALRWLRGRRFDVKSEFERIEGSRWNHNDLSKSSGKMKADKKKYFSKVLVVIFGLVLVQRLSGAGGVVQYSPELFKISGAAINSNLACIIVGTFQLASSGVSLILIDKVRRRTLLLISSAIVTTCLVLLTIYFSLLDKGSLDGTPWKASVLLLLCTFISAFRLGLGPIPWFIGTELMPAEYGGRVQSVAASFSWFLSFLIVKSFGVIVERSPAALWGSFAAYSAVGFVFVALFVPETGNKSREQIRLELAGDH